MGRARDLADAHALAVRSANCSVIIYRKHIHVLRANWLLERKSQVYTQGTGVGLF
jgi:hypothetical protein